MLTIPRTQLVCLISLACLEPHVVAEPIESSWTRHEAEAAETNGTIHGPSRQFPSIASEASGRSYTELKSPDDWIEFTVSDDANGIVLRYSIPDGPTGGGMEAELNWSINGMPQRPLPLTSKFAWVYGEYPWSNEPRTGKARRFFDESSFKIPSVSAGDLLRFAISPRQPVDQLALDFIELENIAPPLMQAANSLSISHYGAVPNDGINDRAALLACIRAAEESGTTIWIPEGAFELEGPRIEIGGVSVLGAGMWHSRLTGSAAKFEGTGDTVHFADLSIFGDITYRDNQSPDNAFNGNFGEGSTFQRLWIEHVKCAFWTLNGTDGLILRDSRIRNVMADGLNFCDGTSRSVVENCHIRNTGDDALATWSPTGDWSSKTACIENQFIGNLIENPWHANGIGIYGGTGHTVAKNHIRETVTSGAGMLVGSGFGSTPLRGTVRLENNRIESTGGDCYIGERVGGIWLWANDSDVEAKVIVKGNTLIDSAASGLSLHGKNRFETVIVDDLKIEGTADFAIHAYPGVSGNLSIRALAFEGPEDAVLQNEAGDGFSFEFSNR